MKYFLQSIVSIALILLLKSCANVVPPGGGPKDNKAAKVTKSVPEHGALNFKGKYIVLEFDEFIKIDNINSKILTTPNINPNNLQFRVDKQKLIITIDSLEENTTYNLTFPECIKDINEGNTTVYQIAFSTGPYLDSCKIKGNVTYPSNTKVKEALLSLYTGKIDTASIQKRPSYMTKVTNGSYQLQNLKYEVYTAITWIDGNKNGKWDAGKEKLGFQYPVVPDTNTKLNLTVYPYDNKKPKYQFNQKFNNIVILNFDENIAFFQSTPYIPYKIQNHTVELFSPKTQKQFISYTVKDSTQNEFQDTITLDFKESKIKTELTFQVKPVDLKLLPDDTIKLSFNKPIKKLNQDFIEMNTAFQVLIDTLTRKVNIIPLQYLDTIRLKTKTGFVIDVQEDSAKKIETIFKKANVEDFGSIEYQIVTNDSTFISQLINKKGEVVHTLINKKQGYIKNLPPDTYSLVYIQDDNGNGKWDDGDIFNNELPEKIIYTNKTIILKANWEIKEQKFVISEQ